MSKRGIILEGESDVRTPDWLSELLEARQELADACQELDVAPDSRILPAYDGGNDTFDYLGHLGAHVESQAFDGAGPGAGGWWRTAYLNKRAIPGIVRRAKAEIREGWRQMRLKYLEQQGFADLDNDNLRDLVARIGPPSKAARKATQAETRRLEEKVKGLESEIIRLGRDARQKEEQACRNEEEWKMRLRRQVSEHYEASVGDWAEDGFWPSGPFAWLHDGSVAYLSIVLSRSIEEHAPSAKALAALQAAGVRLHAVGCNIAPLVISPYTGCRWGVEMDQPREDGKGEGWRRGWSLLLAYGTKTELILPRELEALGQRLHARHGVRFTLGQTL